MTNHPNRSSALARWADARSTSIEIARAIRQMARNRLDPAEHDSSAEFQAEWDADCQRIWEEPTEDEQSAILAGAFEDTSEDELNWGVETFSRPAAI